MAILLKDVRAELQHHLNSQVSTSASFRAGTGSVINAGESVLVDVTATNSAAVDSVQLINVVYHLRIGSPAVARLSKPSPAQGVARSGPKPGDAAILDLAFPVAEYYLHPPAGTDPKVLTPGETDTIFGLPAKALAAGSTSVYVNVLADLDLQWLFPKMEDSPTVSKTLTVAE